MGRGLSSHSASERTQTRRSATHGTPPPGELAGRVGNLGDGTWADAQTIRDLEIFPGPGAQQSEAPSVLGLFDQTRTTGGSIELRNLLSTPLPNPDAIEKRQQALRFLRDRENGDTWLPRIADRATVQIEEYLESYIHPVEGTPNPLQFIRAWWFRTSYREYFEYLDGRVRTLHRVVVALSEMRSSTSRKEGGGSSVPVEITECLRAFDALLQSDVTQQFLKAGGKQSRFYFWRMFYFDHQFRYVHRDLLRRALDALYRMDALLSVARAASRHSFVLPSVASDHDGILCEGLRHPFIEEGVDNDVHLQNPQNFLFLTGPNMAGKTTLMKALGVATYLAHVGFPVPCRSMKLGFLEGIVSSLNVEDNLGKGYSYFFAEVQRVKDVAQRLHQGRRLLVLFDELFKGTNLADAMEGSRMVVDGFLRHTDSLFVLSSHLLELGRDLDHPGIRFTCFTAKVEDGRPRFSYKLEEGLSDERLGMLILRTEGIPELLAGPDDAGSSADVSSADSRSAPDSATTTREAEENSAG